MSLEVLELDHSLRLASSQRVIGGSARSSAASGGHYSPSGSTYSYPPQPPHGVLWRLATAVGRVGGPTESGEMARPGTSQADGGTRRDDGAGQSAPRESALGVELLDGPRPRGKMAVPYVTRGPAAISLAGRRRCTARVPAEEFPLTAGRASRSPATAHRSTQAIPLSTSRSCSLARKRAPPYQLLRHCDRPGRPARSRTLWWCLSLAPRVLAANDRRVRQQQRGFRRPLLSFILYIFLLVPIPARSAVETGDCGWARRWAGERGRWLDQERASGRRDPPR